MTDRLHLLPPNATPLERAISETSARLLETPTEAARQIKDPATCPAPLLPYLAIERGVKEWDTTWPLSVQRAVVAASYGVKRVAGTIGALERALGAVGIGVAVREWFNYGGTPYRFRLRASPAPGEGFAIAKGRQIVRIAKQTKNVRSRLEALEVSTSGPVGFTCASAVVRTRVRFRPVATAVAGPVPFWSQATGLIGAL